MKAVVNGNEVYWVDSGGSKAPPIVLIHGFPFSHEMWTPQFETFSKRFRVIAYDIRGHGKSGVGDGQYMLEFFVDDLIGLLDHLNIEKAVLCGLSMGGYIALRTVERNPDRVVALILADTQAKADSNETKLRRATGIKTIKTSGLEKFAEGFLKTVFTTESLNKNTDAVRMINRVIRSNPPVGVCGALLALATRTDTTDSLSKIKMPTMILVGEHDSLTPPPASQEMHARIPGSEMQVVQNAAHMSNLENSDAFNRHVLSFLERLAA